MRDDLANLAEVGAHRRRIVRELVAELGDERIVTFRERSLELRKAEHVESFGIERDEKRRVVHAEIAQERMERLARIHRADVMRARIEAIAETAEAMHVAAGLAVLLEHEHRLAFFGEDRRAGQGRDPRPDQDDVVTARLAHAGKSPPLTLKVWPVM
jgi:hypothetical protein